MYLLNSLALVGALMPLLTEADGHGKSRLAEMMKARLDFPRVAHGANHNVKLDVRAQPQHNNSSRFLNEKSKKFAVDGKNIPEVPFDVGESYAGVLPISSSHNETRELFFWFFPSPNKNATDEIGIWLNGGPGCSSMSGLITENGPFLWQEGTLAPVENPYSYHKLTNFVWIDQPVGTGFSPGKPNITNEAELSEQFKGFWKNFVDTFELKGAKTYITGESYAGQYVPAIANSFLETNDTKYFNLKGIAINDPVIGDAGLQTESPLVPYIEYWRNVLGVDDKMMEVLRDESERCGWTNYTSKYFTFPAVKEAWDEVPQEDCTLAQYANSFLTMANPCFNVYHITQMCPFPYSINGIVNPGDYEPKGGTIYFNRDDVKKAIHAPPGRNWTQCGPSVFVDDNDNTVPPAISGTLKNVIERTQNVIIGSGALDFLVMTNGTLFAIQNMTWGGDKGLQEFPSTPFYVPQHDNDNQGRLGSIGNLGVWRKERGLTFYDIQLAGHELPGHSASAGWRVTQVMLGRVKDFSSKDPIW